jgi:GTP-binding protein
LNKWDLVKPKRREKGAARQLVEEAGDIIFFLQYAPALITSALTGENIEKLFSLIETIQLAARQHIGTGVLNRLLRQAFEANPPPMVKGRRLKLLYATQTSRKQGHSLESGAPATSQFSDATGTSERTRGSWALQPPEFVLFVNDPSLMTETYRRYLESRLRRTEPYPGLPIILTLRPRTGYVRRATSRMRHSSAK